jgi:hypothetical protein
LTIDQVRGLGRAAATVVVSGGTRFAAPEPEDSMAHNEQENKKPQGGGPQADPSNHGPSKRAGGERGPDQAGGGNKVTQGEGSDTGNKGKS